MVVVMDKVASTTLHSSYDSILHQYQCMMYQKPRSSGLVSIA